MIEQTYNPPCNTAWFQKELDSICKGRNIQLRIAWAPLLYIARTIDKDGRERNYAKYPLRFGEFASYHVGNRFLREVNGVQMQIAYQKQGGLIPHNVLPTDIAQADMELINHSLHIFVIERKLPDEIAKPLHEEKRRLAREHLGFDLFKEFPKEGIWDWFGNIAAHYGVMQPSGVEETCCSIASRHQVMCDGLYREPNRGDLEEVKKALLNWEAIPNVEDKSQLIEWAAKDRTGEIIEQQDNELRELLLEAGECDKLDDIAQGRTRVDLGSNPPLHRTAY